MSSGWASAPIVDDEAPAAGWASAPVVEDEAKSGGFLNDDDKVGGRAARLVVQGVPRALGGMAALAGDVAINTGLAGANVVQRARGAPEFDNPPLPLSTALANSTERWATQLGLPEMPKEGWAGVVGRGLETATEIAMGGGLARATGAGLRRLAPSVAPEISAGITAIGEAIPAQIGIGLAGQAGSEGLGALAPDSMAARLIGAGLGTAAGIGGSVAIPAARGFANRALLRGDAVQDAVDFRVRSAAVNPERAVQDLSRPTVNAPGGPTAAQASGDLGLVQLERDLQTANPVPFTAQREEQAGARARALNSVQPADQGNVSDLTDFVRQQLRAEDELAGAVEGGARERARGAAETIAPTEPDASSIGRNIRDPIASADQAARGNVSRLYQAVDPDGNLTVGAQGTREAANEIYGGLTPTARAGLTGGERTILEQIDNYGPEVSFRELQDLDQLVDAHRRAALPTRGPEYARLVRLKGSIREALSTGAAERIAADPPTAARIQGMRDELEAGTGTADGGAAGEVRSVQAGAIPPGSVGDGAGAGGSGGRSGADGVPKGPRDRRKGLTLSQFIARNGGLPLDAEATARDFGNVSVPGVGGRLARPEGRSIDGYWRNKLIDNGYLPPDPDGGASRDITNELFDALEAERRGRVTRSAADERNQPLPAADDEGAAHTAAVSQIRDEWKRAGMREEELSSRALNDAAERIANGEETDGITAYERAVMALDDEPAAPKPARPKFASSDFDVANSTGGRNRARSFNIDDSEDFITIETQPDGSRIVRDIEVFSERGKGTGQELYLRALDEGPIKEVPENRSAEAARAIEAMIRKGDVERYQENGSTFLRLRERPNALSGYRRDPEAGNRYRAATTAARERKETYGQGAPGAMLRESGTRGNYRMTDASVTANAFRSGPRGAERIAELVRAGAPDAAIADAAALSLSRHVRDGVLDPAGFRRWRQQHEAAFGALPEDVRARFASASLASEALGAATARRREAAATAQRSALGRLVSAEEGDVPKRIQSLMDGQNANRDMGELVRTARRDPAALEGLRRGVADDIRRRVVSASEEVGTSGEMSIKADALGRLLRDKRGMLVQVFGEPHVQTLDAIAEDLIRAKRSTSGGVKIPGGSNTAQDTRLNRYARDVDEHGFLGNILRRGVLSFAAAPMGTKLAAGAVGGAAGAVESALGKLRSAGIRRVDDLLVETLMDPALARAAIVRGRGARNAEKLIVSRLLAKYANPAAAAASSGETE